MISIRCGLLTFLKHILFSVHVLTLRQFVSICFSCALPVLASKLWLIFMPASKVKTRAIFHGKHWLYFGFSWMYWTDWEEDEVNDSIGRIEKAWMDGSNRNIFVTSNMLWPNGLTLDHGTSIMYWCDAYYDHIERIYLNGTGRMVSEMLLFHSLNLFS